jgi:hypothetical protein
VREGGGDEGGREARRGEARRGALHHVIMLL